MKIAIVSDMHIGYERFEEDSYRQAEEALTKASEIADAIIIAGDVFDKRAPKPDVIGKAVNIFRELSRKTWKAHVASFESKDHKSYTNIPVLAIPGTHERVAEGKENVLGLLGLAGLLVDISESTAIIEKDGEKVAVFGLGGVSEERVKDCIQALQPKPVAGAFSIFVMHQSVYEILPYGENIIRFEELPRGFDLYINGHIHSRYEGTVHGKKFLIPGSTVLTQLKEGEQERKGFIVFDTKTGSHSFVEIESRPFVFKRIKFKDAEPDYVCKETEKAIEQALRGSKAKPIIKIALEGTLKKGVKSADLSLRQIHSKYSESAILEIASDIENPELERGIADIRENRMEGTSVKELGMRTFAARLEENGFDKGMKSDRLFEILSSGGSREKVLKEALELLDGA